MLDGFDRDVHSSLFAQTCGQVEEKKHSYEGMQHVPVGFGKLTLPVWSARFPLLVSRRHFNLVHSNLTANEDWPRLSVKQFELLVYS